MERLGKLACCVLDWLDIDIVRLAGGILLAIILTAGFLVLFDAAIECEAAKRCHAAADQQQIGARQNTLWRWSTRLRFDDEKQAVGYFVEFTTAITAESEPVIEAGTDDGAGDPGNHVTGIQPPGPLLWLREVIWYGERKWYRFLGLRS